MKLTNLTLFVHDDIEDAAKFFNIPIALYDKNDVYIMQEDRCVFVGKPEIAEAWMESNEGKFCRSIFPLNTTHGEATL